MRHLQYMCMQIRSHAQKRKANTHAMSSKTLQSMQHLANPVEVWVDVLTMRTNQERLSVRLMAAVIAKPASPAFTGSTTDTRMAVPNTTMLLIKSILMASHLFMICRATA